MPGFNIATLNQGGNGPNNVVETARSYRYVLEVLQPLEPLLVYGYQCTRPNIEFDEVTIHNAQDEIVRPGKHHWKPVEFKFYEILQGNTNQTAKLMYDWWASTMLDINTGRFSRAATYMKPVSLNMLDGDGKIIWNYELFDCWPQKVTPSDLNFRETDIANITVTLRYSKARESSNSTTSKLATLPPNAETTNSLRRVQSLRLFVPDQLTLTPTNAGG